MACFHLDPELKVILGEHPSFDILLSLNGVSAKRKPGRETLCVTLQGKSYFLKKHFGVGWWEIFKNFGQGKKPVISARNEWQAIQYLIHHGIDTMTLVGYGERGLNPARRQSFVITRALENTVTLEKWCAEWANHPPRLSEKLRLIHTVANITRQLHALGVSHRDYYLCHLRLKPDAFKIYVMDLHRAVIYPSLPLRWRIKDLGALYFSSFGVPFTRRDAYRFMRVYRQKSLREIFRAEKPFWKQVEKRALNVERTTDLHIL